MSRLQSLYKDYVQKSRMFLYPALDIMRGVSVTPVQTYVAWDDMYDFQSRKLVCLYHMRDDEEFRNFERVKLLGNKLYHDFRMTEEGQGVYIFDCSKLGPDWDFFIEGRYSRLSTALKSKIRSFFNGSNLGYIDSFLYPDRYFKLYAELLSCDRKDEAKMLDLLKEVGELCSKPDLEKEILTAKVKNLHLGKKLV